MSNLLETQYQFVCDARKVLFQYCATISPTDFVRQNANFGNGGSIRSLLVHIADVYQIWIIQRALGIEPQIACDELIIDIQTAQSLFTQIDDFMQQFIRKCKGDVYQHFSFERNGNTQTASGLMLFTHVITHEFHHKGQILSISRQLGYTPADTDVIH